jgi:hypothetical protein
MKYGFKPSAAFGRNQEKNMPTDGVGINLLHLGSIEADQAKKSAAKKSLVGIRTN